MARVAMHERDLIGPGLALVARVLAAGGIMAGVWLALRATTRVSLRVLRLRGARTLVLGCLLEVIIERVIQRIALVVSCAGRRLLCALAVGIEPHGLLDVPAVEVILDRAEIIPTAGGIVAGIWLALRSTARVLLRVLRLRGGVGPAAP
jgi:hypothetical protein